MISSVPFQLVEGAGPVNHVFRIIRLLRILKLVRKQKKRSIMSLVQEYFKMTS